MPRSSKAPEPPPEPDINELIQNDVARIKRLLGLDVNRLALGSEVEGIVTNVFGTFDYTISGVNLIEFVNVSTSIVSSQTNAPGVPPQTVGLVVTVIGDNQLNLAWTASTIPDHINYKVYRSTVTGFTPGLGNLVASPTSNSYPDTTGLVPGTTYYYKVSDVGVVGEGPVSAQGSGTTTGTAPTPPAQVTGLNVTAGANNSTLNLAWTASGSPGVVSYNIYRSAISGGELFVTSISAPTVTYSDGSLNSGTTYYYKLSAVNNYGQEGSLSVEKSGTTTGTIDATLELHLDSSIVDSSPNAFSMAGTSNSGFILPGQFGTAGWKCNYPSIPAPKDIIVFGGSGASKPAALNMDSSGFSISLWINPQIISALPRRRVIIVDRDDVSNSWIIALDSAGIAYFFVQKAGVDYKAQVSGFTTNSWQHLAATFNGATNATTIYRNAVAGISSSATPEYAFTGSGSLFDMHVGYDYTNPSADSVYQGYYDEIRYYKGTVLTPTQVTNLKNTNAP